MKKEDIEQKLCQRCNQIYDRTKLDKRGYCRGCLLEM